MNYPFNPFQGGGFVPMSYQFQPPFNRNYGFYPNWNGSYQSAQTNFPQITNGQQQGNPYGVLNQGTPVNNNPAFNGNNCFYPNWNGSYQSAQTNIPQITNGQQQGNLYGVLNQGTPVNNNPAFNGNNGGLCLQNYNQPSQSLQMNPGQQQVALASVAQPMPESFPVVDYIPTSHEISDNSLEMQRLSIVKSFIEVCNASGRNSRPADKFRFGIKLSNEIEIIYEQGQTNHHSDPNIGELETCSQPI